MQAHVLGKGMRLSCGANGQALLTLGSRVRARIHVLHVHPPANPPLSVRRHVRVMVDYELEPLASGIFAV
jgi:hypothetical protein